MNSVAIRTRAGALVLLSFLFMAGSSAARARELSFDDRVAAQKAIEQVYWNHRIWPKENPGPKPPLSAVMPDAAVRGKVENYLRMSALLASYWRQPITADQLQAELSRMTRETKAPGTLRELFAALHDDPFLLAECLARPTLAQRRVEAAFAGDSRIHGARRDALASKLASVENLASFDRVSGDHAEIKYVLDADDAPPRRLHLDSTDRTVHLTRTEWDREIARLTDGLGARTIDGVSTLPIGRVSRIIDRGDRFVVFAIRAKDASSITVASVSTPKRSYGDWARETTIAPTLDARALVPAWNGFQLPVFPLTECTDDTWTPTDQGGNVPSKRQYHTAVWTGSEMIVWGGVDAGVTFNTGGRYDPATDSWAASSLTAGSGAFVPSARAEHTAVWTGSEMIVWGGREGSTIFANGGRYSPITDAWAASSLVDGTGANVANQSIWHTAVWTGSEMIVWGGESNNNGILNTGGRYSPSTDSWAACSLTSGVGENVSDARYYHTAVWTGSEMIVWGGSSYPGLVNTGGRYNPATDTWAASSLSTGGGANTPPGRMGHTAVWTGSEMIVWGGLYEGCCTTQGTGGRYDPSTDSWAAASLSTGSGANVPDNRYFHTAVWTGSEMIIWGGFGSGPPRNNGGRYNPSTDLWASSSLTAGAGANTPSARDTHTAVWTGTEMIVWGGHDYASGPNLDTGGRYDPVTDSWLPTESGAGAPSARFWHTAVWTGAEMIVWGGYDHTSYFSTGGRYDPATDSWATSSLTSGTGADVPSARELHTAIWTGTEIIIWGGFGGSRLNTGGRFNPATDTWAPCSLTTGSGANVPSARSAHTAVWTGSTMIVWGGLPNLNTGGIYDPIADTWIASSLNTASGPNTPDGRFRNSAIWTGTEMIIWGGYDFDEFLDRNNGGRYNPATDSWAASSLTTGSGANVPAARDSHVAVWTGTEMVVWGGFGDVEIFNNGGRYNPVTDTWTASSLNSASGPNVPSPRYDHTAVWTGSEMIVWGGTFLHLDNTRDYFNTGGRYDAATDTWSASSLTAGSGPNTPGERTAHSAVWTGSEMIVWGGGGYIGPWNDGGRYCAAAVDGCTTDEQCDDGNACTDDSCDIEAGCLHANNDVSCDDGNACTQSDTCLAGVCAGSNPVTCTASDQCHLAGECDPGTGVCSNPAKPIGTSCDDGNACTVGDSCQPVGMSGSSWTGLIQLSDGSLYGTTASGGSNGFGTVFKMNPDGSGYRTLKSFDSATTGSYSSARLMHGTDGALYGTTAFGGSNEAGTVFKLNPDGTGFTVLKNFDYATTGGNPAAELVQGADNALYGTARLGGSDGAGTVFRLNLDGTGFTVLKNFDSSTTGGNLIAGLIQGSDGALYGTAYQGGSLGGGTIFKLNADGSNLAILTNFEYSTSGSPYSSLVQLPEGTLYGTTVGNGNNLAGTVFKLNPDGSGSAVLKEFESSTDGRHPFGALIQGTDGGLYGTTSEGGSNLVGTVFKLNPDGSGFVVLKTFDYVTSGAYSYGTLLEGTDGALYGTTAYGGTYGQGTVFKLNPDGSGFEVVANSTLDPPIVCAAGTNPLDCDDGNPCTSDACDPIYGCTHTIETGECDDGNPCTTGDVCLEGVCVGEGADCVIAVDPENNATNVAVSTNVTLTYHDPIDPATVTSSTFRLTTPGSEGSVPATLTVSSSGTRATLDPTSALSPDTTYRVESSGIDGPREESTQPFTSYFRTGAVTASTEIATVSEQTAPLPTLAEGGASVAAAGDLNNDGFEDFISGAPGYADAAHGVPVAAGAALVYLGSAGSAERAEPDIIFTGVDAHDRSGVSVAGNFDFNGDGRRDIVIGAEQVDRTTTPGSPAATGKGKAYLIFFDPDNCTMNPRHCNPGASNQVSLSLVGQQGGIPGVVFEGVALGDQAGFSVAGGGTSTPSAATDIIIGAPGADPLGATDAGAAYVVFDNPQLSGDVSLTRISSGLPDQVPGKAYYGSEPGEHVGFSTAFAGPLVSDQPADRGTVLIGAPDAGARRGKVLAPPGDPDTTPIIVDAVGRTEPRLTTQPGFQILGTQPGEQLGYDVADGGDAMEDGVSDLLIGAPTYDVTTPPGAGLAILTDAGRVLQTSQMFVSGVYTADAVGSSIGGAIWQGAALRDQLGFAVTGVGDVTGDGYADIALGAPFVDPIVGGAARSDAGAVYVINGSPATGPSGLRSVADVGTTIAGQRLAGTEAGEHAGSSIAGTGDINGDGRNDFVVGAPDRNSQAGTVYMVLLATGAPVGNCGPQGCVVADLPTGAEVDVPAGGLTTTIEITVAGLLDSSVLPAPVPTGKVLLGAARFTPNGQPVLSPFATIYIPTTQPLLRSRATGAALPLFYFNGTGWVTAGFFGTGVANPSYPSRSAVKATADVLRTYAVFVDDCVTLNCDDGNPCTDDACQTDTGCVHTNNTAPCDDGNLCTTGDACRAGVCTPAFNGLNHPAPKSSEYYRQLCERRDRNQLPWHGDQLTVADVRCVGQLTATFSGIATIDDLCGILNSDRRPPHGGRHHGGSGNGPDGKVCDKAENELVATAINICRARVCEEQNLDSHCHGNDNTTVSQSFAEADAILDNALRTKDTCKDASCELKEINNGHALELNSLTLTRENTGVRLSWSPPELDDGAGSPDAYEVWRRPMGSGAAFTRLGRTTGLSFLDQTSAALRWEYQVSLVVP